MTGENKKYVKVLKAVKKTDEGDVSDVEYADSLPLAKTRIRNHLYLDELPEWEPREKWGGEGHDDRVLLTNDKYIDCIHDHLVYIDTVRVFTEETVDNVLE
jgi:hypothetical protein